MPATNREDYVKEWNSHIDWCLNGLLHTLPSKVINQFKSVKHQALALVQLAADEGFPDGVARPGCTTCLYLGQSKKGHCDGCLERGERLERFEYKNYVNGDAMADILKDERSGERNIVIGGEGEMEVNALWTYEEAYKKLFAVGEEVGGMVYRESKRQLLVTKAFDSNGYLLNYEPSGPREPGFPRTGPLTLDCIIIQTPRRVWTQE